MLGSGRYYAPRADVPVRTRDFGFPKAIVQLNLEFEDGSRASVVTDESWKLTTDGPIRANNEYDTLQHMEPSRTCGFVHSC